MELLRFREKSRFTEALYEATHRVVWSSAFAWIIYACHEVKCSGFLMNFLSSRLWTLLAKMCLSIYLGKFESCDDYFILYYTHFSLYSYFLFSSLFSRNDFIC